MNDITIRFLEVYAYLKSNNKVHTPKGFAIEIGVSNSLITEICKKRTNAGLTPIQNLINRFDELNSDWLLTGKGSMLKSDVVIIPSMQLEVVNYKDLAEARLQIIEFQTKDIARLEKEVAELKGERNNPILYKSVAEPAPELVSKKHK